MPFSKKSKENTAVIETLKGWAFKMNETKGELPFWPLVQCAWVWTNAEMEEAAQFNSDVLNLLIRRIPYYGVNISAVGEAIISEVRYVVSKTTETQVRAVNVFVDAIMVG